MSLTKAEQVVALFRGGMSSEDDLAETVGIQRAYVLCVLLDAGLRQKKHVRLEHLPEADLPPRVHRDPCTYCGVRSDIGCQHTRLAA